MILKATGWKELEPGSLNLAVDETVSDKLLRFAPALVEDGRGVVYPTRYRNIPLARKRYLYFRATASVRLLERRIEVLVRRAEVPPYGGLVELFSEWNLRKAFDLLDGSEVAVDVDSPGSAAVRGGSAPRRPREGAAVEV